MGYKILDVKADIHEEVEKYFRQRMWLKPWMRMRSDDDKMDETKQDVLNIVDKHFEKIER